MIIAKAQLALLAGASIVALASPASAQDQLPAERTADADNANIPEASNEIVVTARRREETLQDVPQTVNVVTGQQIERLNFRNFTDIQAVVPGLTLSGAGNFSTSATVRGAAFNPEASGSNATVEFYLNDAPIASQFVFQSTFDIGQFELLRGPQGTLRGRASPSGSITVTTRRPDLSAVGVAMNASASDVDAYKLDFAFNLPIVTDVLAVRIAGVTEDNEGNLVRSIRETPGGFISRSPFRETRALRATARFEPTDFLSFNLLYQTLGYRQTQYGQVASTPFVTGAAATATPSIGPDDFLAIEDGGNHNGQDQEVFVWSGEIRLAGQRLNYVGSHSSQDFYSLAGQDQSDFFGPPRFAITQRQFGDPAGFEQVCQEQSARAESLVPSTGAYYQCTHGLSDRTSHEIRLSSESYIGGIFEYVVGAFFDTNETTSNLTQETALLASPTVQQVRLVNLVAIQRAARTYEQSFFGNLTAHITDQLELSGGVRQISYDDVSSFRQGGVATIPDLDQSFDATIYNASIKYRLTPDFMVYALVGSSWRPGAFAIGDFNLQPTARERSFFDLPPETSTSYEFGFRSSFFNNRVRFNFSVYQQDFDNYVYRGSSVNFVNYALQAGVVRPAVSSFNFVAAVPARVRGFEGEISFNPLPRWSLNANFSYADGRIRNGVIACNDLNRDGVPDVNAPQPTLAQLQAAVGAGENISQCNFNGRTLNTPRWGASVQSDTGFSLTSYTDGFVRGLATYTPSSEGSPTSTFDDVDSYMLLNLYAGLRDPQNRWELSLFVKNVLDTQRILTVGGTPNNIAVRTLTGATVNYTSDYYSITTLAPREFGVNLRITL